MKFRYCIIASIIAVFLPFLEARDAVNIRGAFYSAGILYLFGDQGEALYIQNDGSSSLRDEGVFGIPHDFDMTAAYFERAFFGIPEFIFLGDEEIFDGRLLTYETDQATYSYKFADFLWHGIDAATTEGNVHYFFKGCEYITRDSFRRWDTNPRPVGDLNIPCHVDAAWNDGSDTLVLKGNQIWVVGGNNEPRAFDDYRSQDKWELQE